MGNRVISSGKLNDHLAEKEEENYKSQIPNHKQIPNHNDPNSKQK
jgi:hypothetical protein